MLLPEHGKQREWSKPAMLATTPDSLAAREAEAAKKVRRTASGHPGINPPHHTHTHRLPSTGTLRKGSSFSDAAVRPKHLRACPYDSLSLVTCTQTNAHKGRTRHSTCHRATTARRRDIHACISHLDGHANAVARPSDMYSFLVIQRFLKYSLPPVTSPISPPSLRMSPALSPQPMRFNPDDLITTPPDPTGPRAQ